MTAPSGYSGTPLAKKLGIKPEMKLLVLNAPDQYLDWLEPLSSGVKMITSSSEPLMFIHLFAADQKSFEEGFRKSKAVLDKQGMLWVSWPKKASGIATDLSENEIRNHALANGLVDVKVCAVSEIWSGLMLVYRLKDR